jgi:hypothetical protein
MRLRALAATCTVTIPRLDCKTYVANRIASLYLSVPSLQVHGIYMPLHDSEDVVVHTVNVCDRTRSSEHLSAALYMFRADVYG